MSHDFKPSYHAREFNNFYGTFNDYNRNLTRVLKTLLNFEPGFIIDLACGIGLSTQALQANFENSRIWGIDIAANMIEFAQASFKAPLVEFRFDSIETVLSELNEQSVDIFFVKSAYHHFDQQIPLSHFKKILSERGVIAIAERTSRSARSYPAPRIVNAYWGDYFDQPLVKRRFREADQFGLQLRVSCYGEHVNVAVQDYFEAMRSSQIFGVWSIKPEITEKWLERQASQKPESYQVYEEFWLYLYSR